MNKGLKYALIALAVVAVIVFSIYSFFAGSYNSMVSMDEDTKGKWSQVENEYQRRLDLIPNLVATVQGYATHESDVFIKLAEARSKAGGVMQISDEVLKDPEAFKRFQQAQTELGSALQRLLVVTENYPELKADTNFLALQDQLEGTENRIATERKRYNDVIQTYNKYIRQFPQKLIANMYGFQEKPYFASDEAAKTAPVVKF